MPKTSKRISALREKVDPVKTYSVDEAVALVKELATAKFDETVELHIRTGLDGRHADGVGRIRDHAASPRTSARSRVMEAPRASRAGR